MVQCYQHHDYEAVAVCVVCSRALCKDCRVLFDGKNICKDCERKLNAILNESSSNSGNEVVPNHLIAELTNKTNAAKEQLEKLMEDEEFKKIKNETHQVISGFIKDFEEKLSAKRDKNGYLICEKCNGYYELQDGESLDDFESCECGGNLKYTKNLKIN